MSFLPALIILAVCRGLDLGSTWLVSPRLEYEVNPLIRAMGWRLTLLLNGFVCFLAAWWQGGFYLMLCALSGIAAAWNLWLYWRQVKKG